MALWLVAAAFAEPSMAAVTFSDDFGGSSIDGTRWNTTVATSGKRFCNDSPDANTGTWIDVSADPACHGMVVSPPYASIGVGGGLASFAAPAGHVFGYVVAGPPSRHPFPSSGDFVLDLRMRYDTLRQDGDGVMVLATGNADPVGTNSPLANRVLQIWADGRGPNAYASVLGHDVPVLDATAFHNYHLEYTGGAYSLVIDGARVLGPIASAVRPTAIWLGHPDAVWWGSSPWTSFSIDSVRVTAQPGVRWDLASDFRTSPDQANPNPDSHGNPTVWQFLQSNSLTHDPTAYSLLPEFTTNHLLVPGLEGWRGELLSPGGNAGEEFPWVVLNANDTDSSLGTIMWPPHRINFHPWSTRFLVVGWKSPIDGTVAVTGSVVDHDNGCGDGIDWTIDRGATTIAAGAIPNAGSQELDDAALRSISVRAGEYLYFVGGPGPSGQFSCDTTGLSLTVTALTVESPPSVQVQGGQVRVVGGMDRDQVTVARTSATVVRVRDQGAALGVGQGCTKVDTSQANCSSSSPVAAVALGRGDDSVSAVGIGCACEGGDGNDLLVGGALADRLLGGVGDDVLDGAAGADLLVGGAGQDRATYGSRTAGVAVTLDGVANDGAANEGDNVQTEDVTGGAGPDLLTGRDGPNVLRGGDGDDTLVGAAGADHLQGAGGQDTLRGGPGDDQLRGGSGADAIIGEGGVDVATYAERTVGVAVRLDGLANDGNADDAQHDNVAADVETVEGGAGNDTLVGSGAANKLIGNGGDDTVDGGKGPDRLLGGPGSDTVSYASRADAITISFDGTANNGNAADGPPGARDSATAFENMLGSAGPDTLLGDAGPNALAGGDGDDYLAGGPGQDGFSGGDGDDYIDSNDDHGELVACGAGLEDRARPDIADSVDADCELRF